MISNFLNKKQEYYSDGSCKRFPNGKSHQTHIVVLFMNTKTRICSGIQNGKSFNEIQYRPDMDEKDFKITIFDKKGNEILYERYINHGTISYKETYPENYNDPNITTKIILDSNQNIPMTEYVLHFGWQHEKEEFIRILLLMGGKIKND
jgi:hypothetical protein